MNGLNERKLVLIITYKITFENSHLILSVSFSQIVYIAKPSKLILCDEIWQIFRNYNRLDGGHCDGTCHRKMAVLGMAGDLQIP